MKKKIIASVLAGVISLSLTTGVLAYEPPKQIWASFNKYAAAIDALGEITGAVVSEDIVNAIFHDFCVGK